MTGSGPRKTAETTPRRRRGGAFRQAGAELRKGLADAAGRRGFAEPEILLRWTEIVGAALAPHCRPVKVVYGRSPALGATLVIEATGARATEIEHLGPRMIERINGYYGYRAISRLRVTQAAGCATGFAEDGAAFAGKPEDGEPPAEAAARAAALTKDIRDPALRAVLTRLGGHILGRPARHRPQDHNRPGKGDPQ